MMLPDLPDRSRARPTPRRGQLVLTRPLFVLLGIVDSRCGRGRMSIAAVQCPALRPCVPNTQCCALLYSKVRGEGGAAGKISCGGRPVGLGDGAYSCQCQITVHRLTLPFFSFFFQFFHSFWGFCVGPAFVVPSSSFSSPALFCSSFNYIERPLLSFCCCTTSRSGSSGHISESLSSYIF